MSVNVHEYLFAGAGEMRSRCRAHDWAQTSLGAPDEWPQSLRTAVQITLSLPTSAVLLWGPDLLQIYNDAYRVLMGVKHPAGLAQATRECWPEVWSINAPVYERVLAGETVFLEDALFPVTRTGGLVDAWFTLAYIPVRDDDGTVAGIMVSVQERTAALLAIRERDRLINELDVERARLEEAFRLAPSFIALFRGDEMCFEFVNESFYDLIGNREVLGRTMVQALPELDAQGFGELLHRVRAHGEPWVGRETRLQLKRGPGPELEDRYVNIIVRLMSDADGAPQGVVAHGSDVTAQVLARRAAADLLAVSERAREDAESARTYADVARSNAERANQAKGRFLAVMSHELRTPLNAIGGYAELIEMGIRGPVTPTQVKDLKRIQLSKRHLLGLINEVLDYAKLETATLDYASEPVLARDVVETAETLVAPQARAKKITLTVEPCPPGLAVRADSEKVKQILVNLLSNAVKFTDRRGTVRVSCAAQDDERIAFIVKDDGIGIEDHQFEHIFEPFVQIRADVARTQEGTGLGLAISRELARAMGGDLMVESVFGRGSTFTLTLPLA